MQSIGCVQGTFMPTGGKNIQTKSSRKSGGDVPRLQTQACSTCTELGWQRQHQKELQT